MAIKILYCIQSLCNSGGMERVLTTKANYLADHYGYEVHISEKCNEGKSFFNLSDKVICHDLKSRNNKTYRKNLSELLFDIQPNITISMYGSEFMFLYKIKDGSKKIVEFHFTRYYLTYLVNGIKKLKFRFLHKIKANLIQWLENKYASKYDKVILLTNKDLNIWGNKPNMCYIYNPISFHSKIVSNCQNKKIIAVGRYIAQKGFDRLIDAFALIAHNFPDWSLTIYGEGQDKQFLQNKIKSCNLTSQVTLQSPSKNIQEEYLSSSIFAFPSRYEGFGLVLTEAMECGLPCIAFDCDCGPSEIIINHETGYLINQNDINEFAIKLASLMRDLSRRKNMGQAGRNAVSRFYENNIMEQWDRLFKELIN